MGHHVSAACEARLEERPEEGLMGFELVEARDWLADCFEDCPQHLTDAEVIAAVHRHYEGGLEAFIAACE